MGEGVCVCSISDGIRGQLAAYNVEYVQGFNDSLFHCSLFHSLIITVIMLSVIMFSTIIENLWLVMSTRIFYRLKFFIFFFTISDTLQFPVPYSPLLIPYSFLHDHFTPMFLIKNHFLHFFRPSGPAWSHCTPSFIHLRSIQTKWR